MAAAALLTTLQSVSPAIAAATPVDAKLALRTLLAALRAPADEDAADEDAAPALLLAQLDALLALAPGVLRPAPTAPALPSVYAKALEIVLLDELGSGGGCCDARRTEGYLAAVVLPALRGEGVRADPSLAWNVCRTAATLVQQPGAGAGLERVQALCRAGMGVGAEIGLEAACMLAVSLCGAAPQAASTAELCAALLSRGLELVNPASGSPAGLVISELLPRLMASLPAERLADARAELRDLFLDLAGSADDARRASGLALGCQFAGGALLAELRSQERFWAVLRDCLADMDDLCRKRALFLLQTATQRDDAAAATSGSAQTGGEAANGKKSKGSKGGGRKAGKRGRRNQAKAAKTAPGWPQFIWAIEAIETSNEALSPAWVQGIEQLGQTKTLYGGPDPQTALPLSVEPWVQLLLALGLRHRHPSVQQHALQAALRGTAYNQRHDVLANGDDFVLACCDLASSPSMAASMFRDVRAVEATTAWPPAMEVHAFLNRHVNNEPQFLCRWVCWFSSRFAAIGEGNYPPAAMLIWLQWLGGLSRQQGNGDGCGLGKAEIRLLAGVIPHHDTDDSCSINLRTLARQSVLSACVKLVAPVDRPSVALAPVLAWASPAAITAAINDEDVTTAFNWLSGLSRTANAEQPLLWLVQDVTDFLNPDEHQAGVSGVDQAQTLATMILLLCEEVSDGSGLDADSILSLPLEVIEHAHSHLYQAPGRKERAISLVAKLLSSATPEGLVYRRLREWVEADEVAAAVSSALRPALLAWAERGETPAQAGDDAGSATQAQADRLARLQGTDDDHVASMLALLGWAAGRSAATETSAADTVSELLGTHLASSGGDRVRLHRALTCFAPHLTRSIASAALIDIEALLAAMSTSSDVAAWWRCLALAAAIQTAAPKPVSQSAAVMTVAVAVATLEKQETSIETTINIIRVIGEALAWLLGNGCEMTTTDDSPAEADAAVGCVEGALRSSWRSWRKHLEVLPPQADVGAQSDLLATVQAILHVGVIASPLWSGLVQDLLQEMWAFSSVFTDLAPVLAWHCCGAWAQFPSVAALCCKQVADMVCYTSTGSRQSSDAAAVHANENELLARGILLLYLEKVAYVVPPGATESLGASMLRALMTLTTAPMHRTPSREYELDSLTHKTKTAVWQALCVLVGCISPDTALARDMHDSAVEIAAWEHFPSERQYLDLFQLRLLGQCPELISKWLPSALANYELRPQIAQGILLVAGYVLLRLASGGGQVAKVHLGHFKSLFPSIVTWVNSGHRQLRSLAQVLVVRLVADCKARAEAARADCDAESAAEYDAVAEDEQLISLHSYLASAKEGSDFRERLSTIVSSFDAELWCTVSQLLGRSNFVDSDGTHGDRVFTPVGKGPDALNMSDSAEGAATACWLPDGVLARIAASAQPQPQQHGGTLAAPPAVPWEDFSIGRGRLDTVDRAAPARRQLVVVASLVEKTPNIAGLCRTCEMLHASSLVVADKTSFTDAQFAPISLSTEKWLPITEVPPEWLEAYLEEQRSLGYQIIAVEQTSTSTTLEDFIWPEKAVLLLGKVRLLPRACVVSPTAPPPAR